MKKTVVSILFALILITSTLLVNIRFAYGTWYFKPAYIDYAPNGPPDFDQRQDAWTDPLTGRWSWCGPLAVANSLWWLDSEYEPNPVPPPTVNDGFPLVQKYGSWDDHDPQNVLPFARDLAMQMDTDGMRTGTVHSGTKVVDMFTGIQKYLVDRNLWGKFYAKMVKMPTFKEIAEEVYACEDTILLLGFWQEQPPGSGIWVRVGGHYVTVPGLDFDNNMIAFCDPYADNAEPPPQGGGGPGFVAPPPPHPHPPVPPDTLHNDALFISYDFYVVNPGGSPSPGGPQLGIYYEPYHLLDLVNNMEGQNCPNEFQSQQGQYNPAWPVNTEVEYGIFVSPGPWYLKSPYPDYAPSGMPDFDQKQDGWFHPDIGWSWCGPVSVANSLWWFDSKYESLLNPSPVPPPTISDSFALVTSYNPGVWDDHDVRNVGPLVNNLAFLMDTDGIRTHLYHTGTWFVDVETGISQYLQQRGINPKGDCDGDGDVDNDDLNIVIRAFGSTPGGPNWNMAADLNQDNQVNFVDVNRVTTNFGKVGMFYEKTVEFPDFDYIRREIYRCEDVELGLEFWNEIAPGVWQRWVYDPGGMGGHYVTCAGANATTHELLFSDPWQDASEAGTTPGISPVPHAYPHLPKVHNDTQYVSYDAYPTVMQPPTPVSPYPGVPLLEVIGYLQAMGWGPTWHAFVRSAIATSPLQIATFNLHTMKKNCVPMPTVCRTMTMGVYVTVKNLDSASLTFNVTAYANSTAIGKQQVSLNQNQNTTLTFAWNTTGLTEYTNYTFSAISEGASGNKYSTNEIVMIVHMGDITGDGKVDVDDIQSIAGAFGTLRVNDPKDPKYGQYWHPTPCKYCPHQPNTDVTGDGIVDVDDLNRAVPYYGWYRH